MYLNYCFTPGQSEQSSCGRTQLACGPQENISLSSWFMALKLLDCAASVLSFQTSVEVSWSFEMLLCKEKMLVVLLLLFCCLLGGTDPA